MNKPDKQKILSNPIRSGLILAVIAVTLAKFALAGSGFLAFPDEFRYESSGQAIKYLSEFRIHDAVRAIFSTQGRPGDALIKTAPNLIQAITSHVFHLNHYESSNSYPLFIFNFLIYCLILFYHLKLSRLLIQDELSAWLSVLFYCCLTNSYIYLRHAMPYDPSLLVFYMVFYKILVAAKSRVSYRSAFFIGFLAFFGYLVYPGYFPLLFTGLCLLFFYNLNRQAFTQKLLQGIAYGAGCVACLMVFEALSRFGGRSYIGDAMTLSSTITLGTFAESFTYLPKYLYQVEGASGILLMTGILLLFLMTAGRLVKRKLARQSAPLIIFISLGLMFLTYAAAGYFFHKVVFYGRLLHQYIPFFCMLSVYAFYSMTGRYQLQKNWVTMLAAAVFCVNFMINYADYLRYAYPRDTSWALLKTHDLKRIDNVCEYGYGWTIFPPADEIPPEHIGTFDASAPDHVFLVNGCLIFPINDAGKFHLFIPPENYKLIYSKPYWLNFKAYQFEGNNEIERWNISAMNLQVKVYSK